MFSKFKHISVEGCDATGKSTLIKLLSDELDYTVVKGSDFQIAEQGVDKMFEYMMNIAKSEQNLIIDRDFISNLVYAPLFDKNMLSDEMVKELINIKKDKSILVYLYADAEDIKGRLSNRGDEYVSVDKIETILESYEKIIYDHDIELVSFNTSIFNPKDIVDSILHYLDNIYKK